MGIVKPEDLKILYSPPEQVNMETNYAPYGEKESKPSKAMIPKAITNLYEEYKEKFYITYPLGFYKKVSLAENEIKEIEFVLREITGKSIKELNYLLMKV